jgi:hypothetical protein
MSGNTPSGEMDKSAFTLWIDGESRRLKFSTIFANPPTFYAIQPFSKKAPSKYNIEVAES